MVAATLLMIAPDALAEPPSAFPPSGDALAPMCAARHVALGTITAVRGVEVDLSSRSVADAAALRAAFTAACDALVERPAPG